MARIQYKGNFYDTNNPQQNAELLRLQRAENLKKAMQSLQPNRQDAPQKKLEAANLLAQNQALLNARTGVPPVSPNTYNVLSQNNGLLEVAPPNTNIDERAARVRSLLDSQQVNNNNTASNQVNPSPAQSAQPQPKRTLGQRASGLFDRVSDAYMGAAPIFAVAQEFQKAGALRPVGGAMQGDPYGKMMEIQQGRQQAENLAQLRQQYPQFANLSDKNFEEVITSLAKDGKLNIGNQLQQTEEQRDANQLRNIKNSMQTGDADAALSYGAIDRLAGGISSVTGKLGLPLKKYQTANTATEGFIRDAMNASRANFDGRQTNLLFEFIKEEMPEPNMNEQQALERTKTVYRRFDDAITGYEQLLDDPNSNLTTSQRGNISKALKLYEGVRDRALVRIKSIEDVISSSKLEKAAGESVYEAPEVSDTNLDTSEINEWNNSLSIREQIQ